jgi:hypothetical protein
MDASALVTPKVAVGRWFAIWFALLALSAILVQYFDRGAPATWPMLARFAIGTFLAPGGIAWVALFWRAFGGGPTAPGLVFIAVVNSTIWLIVVYVVLTALRWLRRLSG